MNDLRLTRVPTVTAAMLIRRPPADVFEAIVDPAITTRFWFTHGSGRLEAGRQVEWRWEMYDIAVPVDVKAVEPYTRVVIEWPGAGGGAETVEWTLAPHGDLATFVTVECSGFTGSGDELVQQVADNTQGFTLMLAGMKALLEHGIELNLVGDRFPDGLDG